MVLCFFSTYRESHTSAEWFDAFTSALDVVESVTAAKTTSYLILTLSRLTRQEIGLTLRGISKPESGNFGITTIAGRHHDCAKAHHSRTLTLPDF